MKDSKSSSAFNLVQTAILLPVVALAAIVTGAFISDGFVFAQDSNYANNEISSEMDDSYFASETDDDRLAQNMLEPRSTDDQSHENEVASDSDNDTEAHSCSTVYIEDDLRIDFDNDPESVLKLQSFLRTFEGYDSVSLTGEFDESTLEAVMSFQTRYAEEILEPWGYQPNEATGYVYITTKKQINEIYCDEQFSLTSSQQQEILEFREVLNELRAQGASFETPNYLAQYYADRTPVATTDTDRVETDETETDPGVAEGDTDSEDDTATTSTTTATTTDDEEEVRDDRNFFQRLFGLGGSDDEDTATTTATSTDIATTTNDTDQEDDESPTDTPTTTDDDIATTSATATAATGSLDGVASGVYSGVNSIFNFLLSPTFLLIVLVILILLLIATVIEGNDGELDDDSSDIDPWAEYDDTQDTRDGEVKAVDSDTGDEAPTPPSSDETDTDTDNKKGDNTKENKDRKQDDSKDSNKKQN